MTGCSPTFALEPIRERRSYRAACGCWQVADYEACRLLVETPTGTRETEISLVAAQCPAMLQEAARRLIDM